jgi:hypothetical protein
MKYYFWPFPEIKSALKERRLKHTEDIERNVTSLKAIQQQVFQKYFQHGQYYRAKCTSAEGEYLENDSSQ